VGDAADAVELALEEPGGVGEGGVREDGLHRGVVAQASAF
jgi:hypothetical protein